METKPISPPATIKIRPGASRDVESVADLWEELMRFHVDLDTRFRTSTDARISMIRYLNGTVLRSRDYTLLVAEVDGCVAGFLIGRLEYGGGVYADPDFGYITDACVGSQYRRLGLARALFVEMKAWFQSRNLTNIRVSVAVANPVSKAFWKEMGFRPFMERWWYDLEPETYVTPEGDRGEEER